MDPNEALRRIRAAIADLQSAESSSAVSVAADELAEHTQALDEWMSRGGFLPTAWAAGR
jgi:hypothetical protein